MATGAAAEVQHGQAADLAHQRANVRFFQTLERVGVVVVDGGPAVVTFADGSEGSVFLWMGRGSSERPLLKFRQLSVDMLTNPVMPFYLFRGCRTEDTLANFVRHVRL